jgi:NAD(P)-dependent dehydrogenase (short-subunit alcohol dehydrogenase family)
VRILVIGATGIIGRAVVRALTAQHEVVEASHHKAPERVDLGETRDGRRGMGDGGRGDGRRDEERASEGGGPGARSRRGERGMEMIATSEWTWLCIH